MPTREQYKWLRERIIKEIKVSEEKELTYGEIAHRIYPDKRAWILIPLGVTRDYQRQVKFSEVVKRQCENLVKEGKLNKQRQPFYSGARYNCRARTIYYRLAEESD